MNRAEIFGNKCSICGALAHQEAPFGKKGGTWVTEERCQHFKNPNK